jgi:hypothetical protein
VTTPHDTPRSLPDRPDLRHLKNQAKDLLRRGKRAVRPEIFRIGLFAWAPYFESTAPIYTLVLRVPKSTFTCSGINPPFKDLYSE